MKPDKIILISALAISAFMFVWIPVWGTTTAFMISLILVAVSFGIDTWIYKKQVRTEADFLAKMGTLSSQMKELSVRHEEIKALTEKVEKNSRSIEALADHLELRKAM